MKKSALTRLGLGLIQHLLAACMMVALAAILFNSYITVQTMDGPQTYALSPLDSEPVFEDSDLFRDIFQTAVADITRLVVIKEQIETNGEFDSSKLIDIAAYANRRNPEKAGPITALYNLEDLIKWGKYGVEYTERAMSMSEFVNYFGPAVSPYNFKLDQNSELEFAGFFDEGFTPEVKRYHSNSVDSSDAWEPTEEETAAIEQAMLQYREEQLEDMAFSYIMQKIPDDILEVSREDDGTVTVYFSMLNGRYETIDKERRLTAYAGNWVDYLQLQKNLEETVNTLSANYQLYQNCNSLYQSNSNLKYVVRMMSDDNVLRTYTNIEEVAEFEDVGLTEYFAEFRRYFIYYPDSLEFMGNTSLTEADIYNYLMEYGYAYPETTHIWIGVDTSYKVQGDAFYSSNRLFENIVPNINGIIITITFLAAVWLIIALYLTMTAGVAYEDGAETHYLNRFDHIWSEALLLFAIILVLAGRYAGRYLLQIADTVYENHTWNVGVTGAQAYEYGVFAAFGAVVSLFACIIWYSLVRRIKCPNLWKDSFLHWLLLACRKGSRYILTHRNSAVSVLLPYNVFLLFNICGILACIQLWNHKGLTALCLLGLIAFDGLIGVQLFKKNGEWTDIADGIKRIRDGEVEFKLDTDNLHGANREVADAVNNIGEGIRKAVNTSMRDEQMKTDLITNVSHDIRNPLTSIISYVDLLKRLEIKEEPAKSYIDVLEGKSQRLKQLTDDLVEASKLSSGNFELNMEKLDLAELLNQAVGELSGRLEEKGLQIVLDCRRDACIFADSSRMWRVMENLFNNIYKYALENTRVYIDLLVKELETGNTVEVSIKNISEQQMNISADELTERFIRGDSSRTTEGSGLGLYITKNLIQAQNGEFSLQLDGDLFKVVIRFPEYVEREE